MKNLSISQLPGQYRAWLDYTDVQADRLYISGKGK
jgi:hypothetical protein